MTYGINIRPYDDPLIAIIEELAIEALGDIVLAGPFPVDIIPISLPGSPVPSSKKKVPCRGHKRTRFATLPLQRQEN